MWKARFEEKFKTNPPHVDGLQRANKSYFGGSMLKGVSLIICKGLYLEVRHEI